MRVLLSTTGTGTGEKQKEILQGMLSAFLKVVHLINPDQIVLFYTSKTLPMVEAIDHEIGARVEVKKERLESPDDLNSCLEAIVDVAKKYDTEKDKLFFHYTYGTKSMSSAMAIASVIFKSSLVYISGKREKGIVQTGTERIIVIEPYRFEQYLVIEEVSKLFNSNNLATAMEKAEFLLEGWKEPLKTFIEGYLNWDLFKHQEAFEKISSSYKNIPALEPSRKISQNLEFLGKLKNTTDEKFRRSMLLVDIVENARRRIESGHYDDAVARLYRATELISQLLLLKQELDDPLIINEAQKNEELYRKILEMVENYVEEQNGNYVLKVGLRKKFEILSNVFNDPIAKEILDDARLQGLLSKRNSSILAHGFDPISKNDAEKLLDIVEYYSTKVVSIFRLNFKEIQEKCRFPKINLLEVNKNV